MTVPPNFPVAVASKMLHLVTFKERFDGLPQSRAFVALCVALYLPLAFAEQFSRGATVSFTCVMVLVGLIIAFGMGALRSNRRVAAGMLLASVPINAALALSSWLPPLDWLVAAWGAIVMLWLLGLGSTNRDGNPTADNH